MVFDIRGKRRHVVKVVYAILAILMAASLFLVTGGTNIGGLFDSSSGESNVAAEYEKRAERLEGELKKQPDDEKLLANLTNNRMLAGQQLYVAGPNGEPLPTVESLAQYQKASAAWSEYLEAAEKPSPSLAQRMGGTLFSLAQLSRTLPETEANVTAAAEAQKIYAEREPNLNSLSTQALYTLFAGNFKEAEELNAAAEKQADTKFQREQVGNQFDTAKKSAVKFQQQLAESEKANKEAAKANKEAGGGAGANPESLESPLGGLGGPGLAE